MITQGSAAAGRFRNAIEAARDAWTKTGLLSISRVPRIREAKRLVGEADATELAAMLVDMAGPIRQINIGDALSARMAQHQKLMGLVCRAALKSETLEARRLGGSLDIVRVQRRIESWIEFGHWSAVCADDVSAARGADMAGVCGAGSKPADAIQIRLTLVAALAPALEHLRLAVDVPDSVLDSMEASQHSAAEGSKAVDAEDAAADAADAAIAAAAAAATPAQERTAGDEATDDESRASAQSTKPGASAAPAAGVDSNEVDEGHADDTTSASPRRWYHFGRSRG